jgi:hypothetical protein
MEEAQHAKLDTLTVEAIAASYDASRIEAAIEGYLAIGAIIDGGLQQQVEFDLESFEQATGRTLSGAERDRFREVQLAANRWTYLGSGMTHPNFLATLERLSPAARRRIEAIAGGQ